MQVVGMLKFSSGELFYFYFDNLFFIKFNVLYLKLNLYCIKY